MDDRTKTITDQRGSDYGPFSGHASAAQNLKETIRGKLSQNLRFTRLDDKTQDTILEGLEMIALKIGRIVNGDPEHLDSWDDIAGYAQITARFLRGEEK